MKSRVLSHQIELCHCRRLSVFFFSNVDSSIKAPLYCAGWLAGLSSTLVCWGWRKLNAFQEAKVWHELQRSEVVGFAALSHCWRFIATECCCDPLGGKVECPIVSVTWAEHRITGRGYLTSYVPGLTTQRSISRHSISSLCCVLHYIFTSFKNIFNIV